MLEYEAAAVISEPVGYICLAPERVDWFASDEYFNQFAIGGIVSSNSAHDRIFSRQQTGEFIAQSLEFGAGVAIGVATGEQFRSAIH